MTATDLQLTLDHSISPCTVITAAGELDAVGAPLLRTQLAAIVESDPVDVVLDLSRVVFIDSTGLGVLARYHKLFAAAGRELRVVVTQRNLRRVFAMTGLNDALFVYESLKEALDTDT